MTDKQTLNQAFNQYTERLEAIYETKEARHLTHWVFETILALNPAQLITEQHEPLSTSALKQLAEALQRLEKGEPVQYVLGSIAFLDCRITVREGVLIPRPETEELADRIIQRHKGNSGKLLDIGTGSGCLGIALAKHLPDFQVYAWENSPDALAIAKQNAWDNGVQITFEERDMLNEAPMMGNWDLIVSNPPYVLEDEQAAMHQNVLGFEPPEALFVSQGDPLIYFRQVGRLAKQSMNVNGWLYFEVNKRFAPYIKDLLVENGFSQVTIKQDLSGKDRFVWGQLLK